MLLKYTYFFKVTEPTAELCYTLKFQFSYSHGIYHLIGFVCHGHGDVRSYKSHKLADFCL